MPFGLFSDDKPDQDVIDQARAHYVLRTAEPQMLAEILDEVSQKLSEQGRREWTDQLAGLGLGAGGDDRQAAQGVVAHADQLGEEGRRGLADTVTPEIAEIISHTAAAYPAFEGFPSSPEAQEIGVHDEHHGDRSTSVDDTRADLSAESRGRQGH